MDHDVNDPMLLELSRTPQQLAEEIEDAIIDCMNANNRLAGPPETFIFALLAIIKLGEFGFISGDHYRLVQYANFELNKFNDQKGPKSKRKYQKKNDQNDSKQIEQ